MKKQILLSLISFLIVSAPLQAEKTKDLTPKLILNRLKVEQTQDVNRDEIYVDLSVFKPNSKKEYFRIPKAPYHWNSDRIDNVKLVELWSETLKEGETINIIISFIDEDARPLNPDDLIGSIRLRIRNVNGKLHSKWSVPNRADGPDVVEGKAGQVQKFSLYDRKARYEVYLSLKGK